MSIIAEISAVVRQLEKRANTHNTVFRVTAPYKTDHPIIKPPWQQGHPGYDPTSTDPNGYQWDISGRVIPQLRAVDTVEVKRRESRRKAIESFARIANPNTDPDEMLGRRMNPILIAPGLAIGGLPSLPTSTASSIGMSAVGLGIESGLQQLAKKQPSVAAAANMAAIAAPIASRPFVKKPVITMPGRAKSPHLEQYPLRSPSTTSMDVARARAMARIKNHKNTVKWEAGDRIFTEDIKRYLRQEIDNGHITGRSKRDLIRLVEDLDLKTTHSEEQGSTIARSLEEMRKNRQNGVVLRPKIDISAPDGLVPTRTLKHEFGHVVDLHNVSEAVKNQSLIFKNISNPETWRGNVRNHEMRANINGGLPENTPWVDQYRAHYGDIQILKELLRKYPLDKPNLPK